MKNPQHRQTLDVLAIVALALTAAICGCSSSIVFDTYRVPGEASWVFVFDKWVSLCEVGSRRSTEGNQTNVPIRLTIDLTDSKMGSERVRSDSLVIVREVWYQTEQMADSVRLELVNRSARDESRPNRVVHDFGYAQLPRFSQSLRITFDAVMLLRRTGRELARERVTREMTETQVEWTP